MGFFESIEKHLDNISLNVIIKKNKEGLIVSVLPVLNCKDEAKSNITPILLKGNSKELDDQFAGIIQQPLELVSGVSSNLIEFERSVSKAEENSVIKKAEMDKSKSDLDKNKKLHDKADKELEKAEPYIKKKEYGKAILVIKKAIKISPKYSKAINKLEEVQSLDTADLFNEKMESTVMAGTPTSMKEVAIEEQQKESQPESLLNTPKPMRNNLESMDDYELRLKNWELINGPNTEPLKGEYKQLSKAMHKEENSSPFKDKPELSGMQSSNDFDESVDDDDFDDVDF